METEYRQLIVKILEVIDYSGNKEKFVEDFIVTTYFETLTTLAESLPEEKQEKLVERSAQIQNDQENVTQVLKEYFTEEQIRGAFQETGINAIKRLLDSLKSSLSDEQKQKMIEVMTQNS